MSKYKGKFVAQCMNGKMQLDMNNRGVFMPCCWCDHEHTLSTPLFKKMEKVSKVAEADSIEDILFSDEWLDFEKIMREGEAGDTSRVPENCMYHCSGRGEDEEKVKIEHHIDEIGESINKHKA